MLLSLFCYFLLVKSLNKGVRLASWDYANNKAKSQHNSMMSRLIILRWSSAYDGAIYVILAKPVFLPDPTPAYVYINPDDLPELPDEIRMCNEEDGYIKANTIAMTKLKFYGSSQCIRT